MNRLNLEARINRLFDAISKPDVQIIDCSNAKESLLKQLQMGGETCDTACVTLDPDFVQGLKSALQAQIQRSEELYHVHFISHR